ncbi:MAG: hypothetical protein AAB338_02775 [Patescibacteria group bacterium]
MDSLFAKTIFLFSFLLASITGPGYIKIDQHDLSFNFKTGEIFPIYYYLNTQNIGPKKARLEISSDVSWLRVYRESTDYSFVEELSPQAAINFILEIHPERLPDGVNKAEALIKAIDIPSLAYGEVTLDEKKISVALNKNFALTLSPTSISEPVQTPSLSPITSPTATLASSVSPEKTQAVLPITKLTPFPASGGPTLTPMPTAYPKETPAPQKPNIFIQFFRSLIKKIF